MCRCEIFEMSEKIYGKLRYLQLGITMCITSSGGVVASSTCLGCCRCIEGLLEITDDVVDVFCAYRNTDKILCFVSLL